MKTVTPATAAHLALPVTSLCTCFLITRKDGQVLRFTDLDRDLVFGGATYLSAVGYDRTAVANTAGGSVDNVEVQFVTLTSGAISRTDIEAGLYDYASVRMFAVNWAAPDDGAVAIREGFLGELTLTDTGIGRGELRGLTQVFQRRFIELYSPTCRADFGDTRCKFALETVTVLGTVTAVTDRRNFTATLAPYGSPASTVGSGSPPAVHDGDYDGGVLRFSTGANTAKPIEVRNFHDGSGSPSTGNPVFVLFLPTPFDIQVGDQFLVYPGCDKELATCRDRWNNVKNFRGEPYVPGTDVLLNVNLPNDHVG